MTRGYHWQTFWANLGATHASHDDLFQKAFVSCSLKVDGLADFDKLAEVPDLQSAH